MIANHLFVLKMHILKIFQKSNHRNMFLFKEMHSTTGVSLSKTFFPYKYIQILKLISSQGKFKGHVFQKQALRPHICMSYLISYHKMILYARNKEN